MKTAFRRDRMKVLPRGVLLWHNGETAALKEFEGARAVTSSCVYLDGELDGANLYEYLLDVKGQKKKVRVRKYLGIYFLFLDDVLEVQRLLQEASDSDTCIDCGRDAGKCPVCQDYGF